MKKAKTATLRLADNVDKRKPLVKEFVDPDEVVMEFLLLRLPYVRNSSPQAKLVYQSKDNSAYRFRVNWWDEEGITLSRYYEVQSNDGQMELIDKQL